MQWQALNRVRIRARVRARVRGPVGMPTRRGWGRSGTGAQDRPVGAVANVNYSGVHMMESTSMHNQQRKGQ